MRLAGTWTRRLILAALMGLVVGSLAPGADAPSLAAAPPQPAVIQLATVESAGNAGFYIAIEKGYFLEQGLQVEVTKHRTGIDYVPALARGQVDVGTTDISAGFLNVFGRDIPIKMVADRGALPPGSGWIALVLRPGLANQVRDYRDLRGLRFGVSFEGAFNVRLVGRVLELGGLGLNDAELVYLPSGDVPAALANGALDASMVFEPQVTLAREQGFAERWRGADEFFTNGQAVVISYGPQFASRTDQARRWMAGYLKGVRDYMDAYRGGPNRAEIVQILTQTTPIRDPAIWDRMVWTAIDPNGRIEVSSVVETQAWFRRHGMLQSEVDLRTVVDQSYADWAVERLGRYQ